MEGDLYRIGTPYDDTGYYGMMYVSKDKKKAVLCTINGLNIVNAMSQLYMSVIIQ